MHNVVKKKSPNNKKNKKKTPKPGTIEAVNEAFKYAKRHKLVYG